MKKPNPRKRSMSSNDFLKFSERISKYVDFRGCETERCIKNRIRQRNSTKLNSLINAGFPFRLMIESWINPHPIYKEILDIDDEEYEWLVDEKIEIDKRLRKWKLK